MVNVLYLAFGDKLSIYSQTFFSMQTLWAVNPETSIHVVTDCPQNFIRFQGTSLTVHAVSRATIKEWLWTGSRSFIFRAKQKAIELLVEKEPHVPVLYLDSDTFFFAPMDSLAASLQAGVAVMHEREGMLARLKSKTEKHVWRRVGNKVVEGVSIAPDLYMWNAGVLGIPAKEAGQAVRLATRLSDTLSSLVKRNHFMEQMAFSIVLHNAYTLAPAKGCVAHYWGNKQGWDEEIRSFYLRSHMRRLSVAEEVELLRHDFNFGKIPYRIVQNNTARRLHAKVDRWLPNKGEEFVKVG